MNLQSQLAGLQEQSRDLTLPERAALRCQVAKQLEKAGEYEAAREALGEFWPDRNGLPRLEGLDQATQARVLNCGETNTDRGRCLAGSLADGLATEHKQLPLQTVTTI